MPIDKNLKARAKQIAAASAAPITEEAAIRQAIRERCGGDIEAAIELAVKASAGWAKEIKTSSLDNVDITGMDGEAPLTLPLGDLYERVPQVIGIDTELGVLLFTKNSGSKAMFDRWQKEGLRRSKSRTRFFTELGKQLDACNFDPDRNFADQLRELSQKDTGQAEGDAA